MTVNEVATLLSCSKSYIYKLCKTEQIPHYRQGSRVTFNETEINEWKKSYGYKKFIAPYIAEKKRLPKIVVETVKINLDNNPDAVRL